jgi:hypothetical protein
MLLLLVGFALVLTAFVSQPIEYLVAAFGIDDGFYYLEVPRNLVDGLGVTYDNRTYTNGFHPLRGAIGALMTLLVGTESEPLLRASTIFHALLILAGVLCLWKIGGRLKASTSGLVTASLLLVLSRMDLWLSPMESALQMALLFSLLWASLTWDLLASTRVGQNVLLGVALALLFLARLDTVFIVLTFLAAQAAIHLRERRSWASLRAPLVTGAVFSCVSAPYLISNLVYFGNIVPVSGIRKTGSGENPATALLEFAGRAINAVSSKVGMPSYVVGLAVATVSVAAIALCATRRGRPVVAAACRGWVVPAFAAGVVLRGAYLLAFVPEYRHVSWYWVPETVLVCLCVALSAALPLRLLARAWRPQRWLIYPAGLSLFIAGCVYQHRDAARLRDANLVAYRAALWAEKHIAQDRLFAMVDSGVFAFFSGRDVLPLNGLITDRATMEKIRSGRTAEVLNDFSVDYVVDYVAEGSVPPAAVVYESETVPDGTFAGKRLTILDLRLLPMEARRRLALAQ